MIVSRRTALFASASGRLMGAAEAANRRALQRMVQNHVEDRHRRDLAKAGIEAPEALGIVT